MPLTLWKSVYGAKSTECQSLENKPPSRSILDVQPDPLPIPGPSLTPPRKVVYWYVIAVHQIWRNLYCRYPIRGQFVDRRRE